MQGRCEFYKKCDEKLDSERKIPVSPRRSVRGVETVARRVRSSFRNSIRGPITVNPLRQSFSNLPIPTEDGPKATSAQIAAKPQCMPQKLMEKPSIRVSAAPTAEQTSKPPADSDNNKRLRSEYKGVSVAAVVGGASVVCKTSAAVGTEGAQGREDAPGWEVWWQGQKLSREEVGFEERDVVPETHVRAELFGVEAGVKHTGENKLEGLLVRDSASMSVLCVEDSHFIVVDQAGFAEIISELRKKEISKTITQVLQIPVFSEFPPYFIRGLVLRSKPFKLDFGQILRPEDPSDHSLLLVLSGSLLLKQPTRLVVSPSALPFDQPVICQTHETELLILYWDDAIAEARECALYGRWVSAMKGINSLRCDNVDPGLFFHDKATMMSAGLPTHPKQTEAKKEFLMREGLELSLSQTPLPEEVLPTAKITVPIAMGPNLKDPENFYHVQVEVSHRVKKFLQRPDYQAEKIPVIRKVKPEARMLFRNVHQFQRTKKWSDSVEELDETFKLVSHQRENLRQSFRRDLDSIAKFSFTKQHPPKSNDQPSTDRVSSRLLSGKTASSAGILVKKHAQKSEDETACISINDATDNQHMQSEEVAFKADLVMPKSRFHSRTVSAITNMRPTTQFLSRSTSARRVVSSAKLPEYSPNKPQVQFNLESHIHNMSRESSQKTMRVSSARVVVVSCQSDTNRSREESEPLKISRKMSMAAINRLKQKITASGEMRAKMCFHAPPDRAQSGSLLSLIRQKLVR